MNIHTRSTRSWATARLLLLALGAGTCASAAQAAATSVDSHAVQRELAVLQGILQTSLANDQPDLMRAALLSGHYLAHQGVVITIRPRNLSSRAIRFSHNDGDSDFSYAWQEIPRLVQDVLVDVQVAMQPGNGDHIHRVSEIRSEQRELREQQRDLRRTILDRRRQLQRAVDGEEAERLAAEIGRLEDELDVIQQAHQNLEVEFAEQINALETTSQERRQVVRQDIETELEQLRTGVLRTLCDYGASVRSVAPEQYITVILDDVLARPDGPLADRIIVSRKSDLSACQNGSISVDELSKRVTIYDS